VQGAAPGRAHMRSFELERYFAEHEFKARYLLSASDCESMTLPRLLALADPAATHLWQNLHLGYTESQGHPLLREEIAGCYATIHADDVLVAAPEEAIFIAMNTLLSPGDHVIVTFPAYQSLREVAVGLGCRVTHWPLQPVGEHWRLDLDFLQASLGPDTKLIVINFPHNPTGHLIGRSEMAQIIEMARQRGIYVFSDEMYRGLEYEEQQRLPAACDLYEHAISLAGLSKVLGLPGLRIGWLATQDQVLLARFSAFHDYTTICNSAPSEILGIMALRARDQIVERNLRILRANLGAASHFFSARSNLFTWMPPRAGSVAFPKLGACIPVVDFCRELLEKEEVMVIPGTMFDFMGNHFRVGLGRSNLPETLERVGDWARTTVGLMLGRSRPNTAQ